ncbi:Unannotated [Lentimonas sp. CC4]|nr:Unannotated [Lentimonas sp. CC4]CAA6686080.1 Unannotated [Lentimonas sp. CC6]CAA7077721.1 Unannotated [Lentimonas sp. CC4]CAA7168458.1 Unannotated [Lentimonas sp. CC21]CAA7182975.1 Unannotated [Lentimonas sp. CC8]
MELFTNDLIKLQNLVKSPVRNPNERFVDVKRGDLASE